ncbi:MAG TPA: sigma-70 family RNA polymerase sigma factor [Candidatus Limnocylindrales bacterium]|nr:sigma-70 family RNA polymerase sigma factor [Candidatus Limnocylindrales bacterium]
MTGEDAGLVRAVASGSEDALVQLYDRYAGAVYATARRLTTDRGLAEDVVQETFLALWNRAEQYDPAMGSLPAWLLTIARNRTIDRLRALGRRPPTVPVSDVALPDEGDTAALERLIAGGEVVGAGQPVMGPAALLAETELRTSLAEALAELPDVERAVLVLAYRDELSQSEIAERLGWPIGTVKTRTRRALLRMRNALGPGFMPVDGPGPVVGAAER